MPKVFRVNWKRLSSGSVEAFVFATFLLVVAALARWGLGLVSQNIQPFTTFYPAVLFATLVGGAGAGTFVALVSALISWWAFLPPYGAFLPLSTSDQINVLDYVFVSLLIVWAVDHYRRISNRLEDEEKFRKLTVDELAHRLKNKLATIQSIISFQLREEPPVRDAYWHV